MILDRRWSINAPQNVDHFFKAFHVWSDLNMQTVSKVRVLQSRQMSESGMMLISCVIK